MSWPRCHLRLGKVGIVPDKIEITTTYLQMLKPPSVPAKAGSRIEPLAVMRCNPPSVSFYRYLYDLVGRDWAWYERLTWSDAKLAATITAPTAHIYVLYVAGVPAGFCELDCERQDEVEIVYFGLATDFQGRGLGSYWIGWTVGRAWSFEPKRVWLHTCTLDHPRALSIYQKVGFRAVQARGDRHRQSCAALCQNA